MAERYTRLFALTENLYQSGSPILIAAGALLKDTQTGRVLAQIKLQSISDQPIKAVKVNITPIDVTGATLGDTIEHQYLDLNVKRDEAFGTKSPVYLPNATARGFTAEVRSVVFADNSVWTASDTAWEPLPAPVPLAETYPDTELRKQFQLEFGESSQYAYAEFADLCRCPCGALNRQSEGSCHTCGCDLLALRALDTADLESRKNERLEQERIAEEERFERARIAEEQRRENAAIAAKRAKKIAAIVVPIACVAVAFLIVLNSVIIPNNKYNNAVAQMEEGEYKEAIEVFVALDGYKDSAEQVEECEAAMELADLNAKYDAALALMEAEEYEEAIEAFEALDGHKDSKDKISECETAILDGQYEAALALMDSEKYERAITAFEALAGYKESKTKIKECETAILDGKYEAAVKMLESGNYRQSLDAFDALGNYKDSKDKRDECKEGILKTAEVGDYAYFGSYEQDNNISNGQEEIEWIVLAVEDDRALLISKYGLDCKPYNEEDADVTWETCTLRTWLNGTFLNTAFTADEQVRIPIATALADAPSNMYVETKTMAGNDTQDKVFLLSDTELMRCSLYKVKWHCQPTAYAVANGVYSDGGDCSWWLRTPGYYSDQGSVKIYVESGTSVDVPVYIDNKAVRPAIWVDLNG